MVVAVPDGHPVGAVEDGADLDAVSTAVATFGTFAPSDAAEAVTLRCPGRVMSLTVTSFFY
jgi:hypothetical protein